LQEKFDRLPELEQQFLQNLEYEIPYLEKDHFWNNVNGVYIENNRITKLAIGNKKLTDLPNDIENLSALEYLDLSSNQISDISANFHSVPTLKHLDLENNHIEKLSQKFGNFNSLESLNLSKNRLKSLPDTFRTMPKLKVVDISNNQLQTLPKSFSSLSQLKKFDCSDNQLTDFPQEFSNLTSLEECNMGRNFFRFIPEAIANWKKIELLTISKSQITYIAKFLLGLKNLYYLDLSSNKIYELPEWITEFQRDMFFRLARNPFQDPLFRFSRDAVPFTFLELILNHQIDEKKKFRERMTRAIKRNKSVLEVIALYEPFDSEDQPEYEAFRNMNQMEFITGDPKKKLPQFMQRWFIEFRVELEQLCSTYPNESAEFMMQILSKIGSLVNSNSHQIML
jgi:hypothetical protein